VAKKPNHKVNLGGGGWVFQKPPQYIIQRGAEAAFSEARPSKSVGRDLDIFTVENGSA